jgi:hypothetical protein
MVNLLLRPILNAAVLSTFIGHGRRHHQQTSPDPYFGKPRKIREMSPQKNNFISLDTATHVNLGGINGRLVTSSRK